MTELEKMLSGIPYDTSDKELRALSSQAKNQMRQYNNLPAEDVESRNQILKLLFGECGKNIRVNQPIYVDYGRNISIGDYSLINMNCTLLDTGKITIGHHTLVGPDVKIYTAFHSLDGAKRYWTDDGENTAIKTQTKPVIVGNYVWIGGGAVILPGVTIGDNAVIGAGSVVTGSIPANAVACGNPCVIKKYNKPLNV